MASEDKRKNKNICKCGCVVDSKACELFVQWTPGNSEHHCQKHFPLWQEQVNTRHQGIIEREHTSMVSLTMHQPAFGNKKLMVIKRSCNHVP
jgi:hypothetical protein